MVKNEFKTLGFRIYIFKGKNNIQEAKGNLVFYGNGNKRIDSVMFNRWNEISNAMKKLVKDAGYESIRIDNHWEFVKK